MTPPAAARRRLVVSIHDVSPHTWPAVARMLDDLRGWGVGRTSLLIVPDHHGRGHFLQDSAFCRAVERLVADEGHEPVIHGYYHQRPAGGSRGGETPWTRWVTGVYTAGEGEFYDLPAAAAAERLARAQADFARLDLPAPPVGFIAPAWLLGEEAGRAVRAAGFAYTTRLGTVEDFTRDQITHSQSLVWSCRNGWRRAVSLVWNALLFARLRGTPLLRIGLHPPDREHPAIWRQVQRLVRAGLKDRETATYAELIDMKGEKP